MKITKTTTSKVSYYECQLNCSQIVFAFTLRQLVRELIVGYGFAWFKPLNLN